MSVAPDRKLPVVRARGGCPSCMLFQHGACYGLTGFEAEVGCGARCAPDCAENGDWTCDLKELVRLCMALRVRVNMKLTPIDGGPVQIIPLGPDGKRR